VKTVVIYERDEPTTDIANATGISNRLQERLGSKLMKLREAVKVQRGFANCKKNSTDISYKFSVSSYC
jgi:hypothetical protein